MRHWFQVTALVFVSMFAAGCGGSAPNVIAPTPVPAAPPPLPVQPVMTRGPVVNWIGDATVVASTRGDGGPCGWGTSIGETRSSVYWHIEIHGNTIELDQDLPNWPTDDLPYKGTLQGTRFTATYVQGEGYLNSVCRFREAAISGTFNSDFSTFEADETLGWGTPHGGSTVQRRWTARLAGQSS